MYSTRCPHCRELINFKTEEVRAAVNETQAAKKKHYEYHCPKCGKLMKIQVSELKRRLPREDTETPAEAPASADNAPDKESSAT